MSNQAGIYIHIPFCERKCIYCGFNSIPYDPSLAEAYVQAVCREIEIFNGVKESASPSIDTIYIGGGTPSILKPELITLLLDACKTFFSIAEGTEITIEVNPSPELSQSKIMRWLESGINRVSIGVQSFIDDELRMLQRTHTAKDARNAIYLLRECGVSNLSMDLMAGLPEQTLSGWKSNLQQGLAIEPEHLSVYLLEIKDETQLAREIEGGQYAFPDDDHSADQYRALCLEAKASGYEHYEISNFALLESTEHIKDSKAQNRYRSRHNMKYWTGLPYFGYGAGAHSFDSHCRWSNIQNVLDYIKSIESKVRPVADWNELSIEEQAADALFMGLRLIEGINLEEFRCRYSIDVLSTYAGELSRLGEAGLLEISGGYMRLTEKGFLLSNEVFVTFV